MYSKKDIELIKEKIDMVEFLESRGINMVRRGMNYVGLCPVHSERSPSFNVRTAQGTYHCFGCGISGDIFSLIQDMDGLSFTGAIEELAEISNIQLEKTEEDEEYKKRKRLYEICDIATVWYRQNFLNLPEDAPAKKNLNDRGLLYGTTRISEEGGMESSYSAMQDNLIGFAPARGLLDILFQARYSKDEILSAGLLKIDEENKVAEVFRNRLLWAITDVRGKTIGFSGRRLNDASNAPKYLNSPQTPLYNKSNVLLNLGAAKESILKKQEVYVVEGQTDVMALKTAGIMNVVATCGTAFGADHANILLRLSAAGRESDKFRIIFCFDGDAAGVKAAKRVFESVPSVQLTSNVVRLAEGDPCDYRLANGDEALLTLVTKHQVSLIEFILKEETNEWDMKTVEGRTKYIEKARTILKLITNPVQHSEYVRLVSFWTGIPLSDVSRAIASPNGRVSEQAATPASSDGIEARVIAGILQYPELATPLWTEFTLTPAMFGEKASLAKAAHGMAKNGELDLTVEGIPELAHFDLGYVEGEEERGLKQSVKQLLQASFLNEASYLSARVASAEEGEVSDEELLGEILASQAELRKRYSIPDRRRHQKK